MDIESALRASGGLATTGQLLTTMNRKRLAGLVKLGRLIRVCRGVYGLHEPDVLEQLAALDLLAREPIVVCMSTAAALYGFDTERAARLHILDPGVRMRPSGGSHGAPAGRCTATAGRGAAGDGTRVDGDRGRTVAAAATRSSDA